MVLLARQSGGFFIRMSQSKHIFLELQTGKTFKIVALCPRFDYLNR
jgi:hypothetical protein